MPLLEKHLAGFDRPFVWERHCALFGATWVETVTGHNPLAGWPQSGTALQAAHALRQMGFATLIDAVSAALPRVAPAKARIGDIVARQIDGVTGIGISAGRKSAFLGTHGLQFLSTPASVCAWSVG